MKNTLIISIITLAISHFSRAADTTSQEDYKKGQTVLSIIGQFKVNNFSDNGEISGKGGYGLGIAHHLTSNLALTAEVINEETHHSVIDQVGGGLKYYFPIGNFGLAPYVGASLLKGFEDNENFKGAADAGIEWRTRKYFGFFAGARYIYEPKYTDTVVVSAGTNFRF